MNEILGTIAMLIAVGGVKLNNHKKRLCFYLFIVSNLICLYLHTDVGLWSLVVRDAVFLVLAFDGLKKWGK